MLGLRDGLGINYECPVCHLRTHDQYMVTIECWQEAGLDYYDNLHLACLEIKLGRPLVLADFTDAPINDELFERFERAKHVRASEV